MLELVELILINYKGLYLLQYGRDQQGVLLLGSFHLCSEFGNDRVTGEKSVICQEIDKSHNFTLVKLK